ncbi:autotransporter-associated beta strand protein [Rhizomicrobium palustre]|uniref:Autotransporter-associated beta strand protein n=1 Tax=Rhizomicrobium palustre TaxID=189966 RepID=A0A846MV76_9PROT|nr:autotransporter outer membrane beta-barrel domain-containing protein [Rhizomicrobium palustre]NIK87129.1 autotransporter-associated beta strand protein [Rhizomicrobium palustre]
MTETASLAAGSYTFYWSYAAGDYKPYNDGVLFAISGGGTETVSVLANNGDGSNGGTGGGAQAGTVVVGDYGATQWAAYTFTVATSSTYQLSFAAYNWGDTDNSYVPTLYIGASAGTVTGGSTSPIDTNHTYYLASNLGSSVAPDFKGGTLRLNASGTISNAFAVENYTGNTIDAYGNTGNFSGVMSGAGGLTIKDGIGGGKVIFTGANTYTGGTTINSGAVLQIGIGGTTGSIAGNVNDLGTLIFNRNDAITYANVISGTGGLIQAGSGTLTLTGTNTYTGGTTIGAGTLQIGDGNTSGSIAGDIVNNAALAFNRSDAITFAGAISGTGALTQAGSGTLVLTGANTYTGGTTIGAGTLQIGDGNASGSIAGDIVNNAALAFNRSDAITFAGAISGTGTLTQAGSGTLVLTGANTYTGGTTISAGTLQIGDGNTSGSIAGDITNNAALIFNRSDAITYANVISGTGKLTQAGSGTLILTGTNTYSDGTTVSAGTLQIGNGSTSGAITGNVVNNATLAFNRSDSITYGGIISGTGGVSVSGGGTVIVTGNNTYTGQTSIAAGSTLQIGNGGTTGAIVSDVINQGILAFNRSDNVTFNGNVTGSGTLVQNGTGKVIVTTNYTGKTIVNSGTLQIGNGSTSGTVAGNIVNNATVVYGQAATTTYSGVISGAGSLAVSGGGIVILNGSNTYTGPTTVTAGSLIIGDSTHQSATVLSGVTVSNNAIIGGYGLIGGNLLASGGTVSPGNSIGTLTVSGNYSQSSASTLKIEVTPTASDKLLVKGKAQLDGTLAISLLPGTYGTTLYPVLTASSISGTFATVTYTGGDANMAYGVMYGAQEVDLAVTPKASGQIYGDIVSQSLDTAVELNNTTLERLNSSTATGWSAWSKTLAGASHTSGDMSVGSFNAQLWGVISGADYQFSGGTKLSGVFSYTHNQIGVHDQNDKASVEGYFFALASHIPANAFTFDVSAFLQNNVVDTLRRKGGIGDAAGSTNNLVGGGSLQAKYSGGNGDLQPFARLTVASIGTESFTEAGTLGFAVASQTRISVRGSLGLEASHTFLTENGTRILPRLQIGMENEFGEVNRETAITFASTNFLAPAPSPSRFGALVGAGVTAALQNRLELSLDTRGRISANQIDGIVSFGAKYKF